MDKEVKKRFSQYSEAKEKNLRYLETIEKNKSICLELLDNAIKEIAKMETKYLEGYELRVANEVIKPIEDKEFINYKEWEEYFNDYSKGLENINIDIVLKNSEEEITIGKIDCDIKVHTSVTVGNLRGYDVHLNYVDIFKEYKDRGYGGFILKHIPMIISDLYKGEVYRVTTTANLIEFDKYKIHETKYSERIKVIENWLISNNYTRNSEYIKHKDDKIGVFQLDQGKRETTKKILSNLEKELSNLCFTVFRNDNDSYLRSQVEKCKEILEKLFNNKYSLGIEDRKILELEKIKDKFLKAYDTQKDYREDEIKVIDKVKLMYENISIKELEVLEDDTFNDIAIKLYCKYFNLGKVSKDLGALGLTETNKKGEQRNLLYEEVKDIITESDTEYSKLKEYAGCILEANRISN